MIKTASEGKSIQEIAENGLLVAVIVGTIIAVSTQQLAWGLIPSTIALIFNRFNRQQEENFYSYQFSSLKNLIQNHQIEQDNQQINVWELQQKLGEVEQLITELRENQTQETAARESQILESNQLQSIERKQEAIEREVERLSLLENTINNHFDFINQQQENLSQSISDIQTEVVRVNQNSQEAIQELKQELDSVRSSLNSNESSAIKLERLNQLVRQNQQRQTEIQTQLSQIETNYQTLVKQINQQPESDSNVTQETIETLESQIREANSRQTEENQYYQQAIQELKQELDNVRSSLNGNESSAIELERLNQLVRQNQQRQTEIQTQLSQIETNYQTLLEQINQQPEEDSNVNLYPDEIITESELEAISTSTSSVPTVESNLVRINCELKKQITPNAGKINAVAFSPNGKQFISGHQNKTIKLWSLETGGEIYSFQDHSQEVLTVAYHPDGEMIASGSRDKTIKLWSVSTGNLLTTLEGHVNEVLGVTFSVDGKILGSCSKDRTVKLWSVEEEKVIDTFNNYEDEVKSIALSADGKWLATGEGNIGQTVRLLQLETRETFTLETDQIAWFPGIHSLAFSPDSNLLVGGRNDHQIILWDVKQQQEIRRLQGHENKIYTVVFHPQRKIIATGSEDKTIKLWNVNAGEEMLTLTGHRKAVLGIAFSPDGHYLISGSQDETLLIWENHYLE